ncbi:MAG: SurA N-terminal domain-containing protein [Bacteriovorax sp.]|nr:SurA N-terminal domain-containing protein [Bacteriovorax sp.]
MSEFTKNKTANMFATLLIGIIVLSFMFTGYQSFQQGGGSPNAIGKVGDLPIKTEEYQQEYNRQIEFYKQMMGGEISAKQIEAMKIKESTLKNIVQRKLMVKFATDIGAYPSVEEIKSEIKTLPYFLSNGQFDINRYKAVLAANKLTPAEFEADVINQLKMKNTQGLVQSFPLSKGYLNDLQKIRDEKLNAEIISISKNGLRNFVEVSKDELTKFLAVETNQKRLQSMFNERKPSLDKPEEVKARHILLMAEGKKDADLKVAIEKIAKEVNPSNFAKMADKYTEDPSGKGKGGDLGTFGKGRMVPEFDQVAFTQKPGTVSAPIKTQFGYHLLLVEKKIEGHAATFAEYKDKFATELIQKDKVEAIKKLTVDISNNLRRALLAGNANEVKAITEKYKLQYVKGSVNRLDGTTTGTNLTAENMKELFSGDLTKPQIHLFDDGASMVMIKTTPATAAADLNEKSKVATDNAGLKNALSRKMMESILKKLEEETKVKIYSNMLQE